MTCIDCARRRGASGAAAWLLMRVFLAGAWLPAAEPAAAQLTAPAQDAKITEIVVTARKKDEAALRVAEARWRTVVASKVANRVSILRPVTI